MLGQVERARQMEELTDLSGAVVPSLEDSVTYTETGKLGLPVSPGFPGTLNTAVKDLSVHVGECFGCLSDFSSAVKSRIDQATHSELESRKEISNAVKNALNEATTLENMLEVMIPNLADSNEKLAKEVNKIIEKETQIKGSKTKSLMKDVKEARTKLLGSRTSILTKASQESELFVQNIHKVGESCERRVFAIRDSLDVVYDEYSQLAEKFRSCAESLRSTANKLNFREDFTSHINNTKLIRYDIQCLPFESIDVSHAAFADIDTRINVAVPPLYPVSLAKVVNSFTAESSEEISCTKGKNMLLMEKPDNDWVFVMNPMTLVMGYAPRDCFEEIGKQLGVFLKTPASGIVESAENVRTLQGDYVAVIGEEGDKLQVVTMKGDSIAVPKDLIGIIYN